MSLVVASLQYSMAKIHIFLDFFAKLFLFSEFSPLHRWRRERVQAQIICADKMLSKYQYFGMVVIVNEMKHERSSIQFQSPQNQSLKIMGLSCLLF